MIVGLHVNAQKLGADAGVARLAHEAIARLGERGVSIIVNQEAAGHLAHPDWGVPEAELGRRSDVVIVFGGDGTILRAARSAAPHGIPILGVNLGGFGFLAEVSGPELEPVLHRILERDYELEERMMLRASVQRAGRAVQDFLALNDIVVTKSGYARLLKLCVLVNDEHLATHLADGWIVATPTGSTAYSLSAGGPIVHPAVDGIVLTPICPHSLNARAVVVSGGDAVAIQVEPTGAPPILTVDGQEGYPLHAGDVVQVGRSPHRARLVRLGGGGFYERLQAKLTWGR